MVLIKSQPLLAETVLDAFEDIGGWAATATEGARVELGHDRGPNGMALRIDFDFTAAGGYVLVRKALPLRALPANYAVRFRLRGAAPPSDFELKLIDKADKNVWWYKQRDYAFPADWREVRIKKPRFEFAWGPAGGGPPTDIGAVEFAVTGAEGEKGSLWIDDLTLEERLPPLQSPAPPRVTASTAAPGEGPEHILDDDPWTRWASGSLSADQWLQLDFGRPRELGGLVIDWDRDDYAVVYDVQLSDDGEHWTPAYRSRHGRGGRDYVYLPDAESRFARVALQQSSRGQGYAIRRLSVMPPELAASPNRFFAAIAAEAPPGTYPKYFSGRQTYWTVIGAPGGGKKALINEEGMIEVEKGGFSVEPFLFVDGRLITWRDVQTEQGLEQGYLPIPIVTWRAGHLTLTITALAVGAPQASALLARYRLDNVGAEPHNATLVLAVRPFQVLPPWQSLNMVGGTTQIHDLAFNAPTLWVNRRISVTSLTPPARSGASSYDEGQVTEFLVDGSLPPRTEVSDPIGFASAAMQYPLHLDAQQHDEVYVAVPFHDGGAAGDPPKADGPAAQFDRALTRAVREWETALGCVDLQVPPTATDFVRTLKTNLGYVLINRDGPAIQPGARTYARSWIRDGAMTSAALLEMGFPAPVRDFLRWYARYQYPGGRIPCCVDRHGGDPLPEHDSNGEFLYAIGAYYRYTRDIGFVYELWPAAVRAVDHLEALRAQRLGDAYKQPDRRAYYGLLPESASHEGYAAHPVHSYWDDFFAVRGLKDAALLAVAVDDAPQATRIAALRYGLRTDLYASIARVIETRRLDYVPASVELADFDPASTAIALEPGGEQARLPADPLRATFARYHEELQKRLRDEIAWDAYSPYELRTVGALVRLGRRREAMDVLGLLMAGRRPTAWNQWAEIVWRDAAAPLFIGDMPHTWVGSGFIAAVRGLFAYEREDDSALVLAAGLPLEWVTADGGVGAKRLPTQWGVVNYTLRAEHDTALRLHVAGDLEVPPGGIEVQPPLPEPLRAVTVNGQPLSAFAADRVTLTALPADVVLEY